MAGWLVLTYANDAHEAFETPGETFIEVATHGYPVKRALGETGVVSIEWFAEEPKVKGKTVAEQAEIDEEKEQKERERAEKAGAKA